MASPYQVNQQSLTNLGDQAVAAGLAADKKVNAEKTPKQLCEEKGGSWDDVTQTCILAPQKGVDTSANVTDVKPPTNQTLGGKPVFNYRGTEVDKATYEALNKRGNPKALTSEQQAQFNQAQANTPEAQAQAQREQALSQLGLSPEQIMQIQAQAGEAPIDWGQAITAGIANFLPSAVAGGVGGAAIGLVGSGGALSAPLAIAGGVGGALTGFFNGVRSNIKSQQSGEIQSTQKALTNVKSNLRQIRMLAQADPSRADEAVELYNQQMALAYAAQAKLKRETSGNLNAFMDDGTEKLAEFDLFFMPGGYADLQRIRIEQTLGSGVAMSTEQILLELQSEGEQ